MQLSAFFPFYRNHNTLSANSQEAYGKPPHSPNIPTKNPKLTNAQVWSSVIEASKSAMQIRYSLLPYMYTLFYLAHTTGSTVMRALSWEFPTDPTLADVDNQFLLGPSLMIVPVLGQGLTHAKGVFPGVGKGEVWYDWYMQTAVQAKAGENVTIPAPLGHIPVYIRGGAILPQQEALYTTTLSRQSPWSLICALTSNGTATGQLYVDDGESVDPSSSLLVAMIAKTYSISATVTGSYMDTNPLANVTVLGVERRPGNISFNGMDVSGMASYNGGSKVLSLKGLEGVTGSGAWSADWVLTWM